MGTQSTSCEPISPHASTKSTPCAHPCLVAEQCVLGARRCGAAAGEVGCGLLLAGRSPGPGPDDPSERRSTSESRASRSSGAVTYGLRLYYVVRHWATTLESSGIFEMREALRADRAMILGREG